MTDVTITIEEIDGGIKLVHVSGQLDESNVDEKIKDIYKLVEQNPTGLKVLLDLENLSYLNSKAIGYLTDLYGKISDAGGKIVIAKAKANIIDILQVVGLTQLIQTFDSIEAAKPALLSAPAAVPPTSQAQ